MSIPLRMLGPLERRPSHEYDPKRDAAYYLVTAGGIVISLAIIAATFPLLTRITGPEVARNE
jgi:hypothetical protein